MATTQNTYTGDGSTVLYSFTFPYIEATDVNVSVDGVDQTLITEYTLANATTIQFVTAPAVDAAIRIYRTTSDADIENVFYPGSAIRARDLNDNFTQTLYVVQENSSDAADAVTAAEAAQASAASAQADAASAAASATSALASAQQATLDASAAQADAAAAVVDAAAATTAANTAVTDAATAISTANAATTTANSAQTDATAALAASSTASTDASAAVSTANAASTLATTADTNATTALNTANSAQTDATTAINTANSATAVANAADTKADSALSSIASVLPFETVANVAAIPGSPSDGDSVKVVDSTGIESFTPLSGLPVGFVGDSGINVSIRYETTGSTWEYLEYFPNDPDERYQSPWDTNGVYVYYNDGRVGIGTNNPTSELHIKAANKFGGILVEDNNSSQASPEVEIIGKRSDGNNSPSFAGKLCLAGNRTDAAVSDTKNVGTVLFGGNHTDGSTSNILYTASVGGVAEGTFSDANTMPTGLAFYTGSTGRTTDTANVRFGDERMRIDSNGNVGIGTNNPTSDLHIRGSSANIKLEPTADTQACRFQFATTDGTIVSTLQGGGSLGSAFRFVEASSESMRITGGKVGIGTSSPSQALDIYRPGFSAIRVQGDNTSEGQLIFSDNTAARIVNTSSTSPLLFSTNSTERVRIDSDGKVGIGTANPDGALDVREADSAADTKNIVIYNEGANGFGSSVLSNRALILGADYLNNSAGSQSYIAFETDTTERMRIGANGFVGIGTDSPQARLDVRGVAQFGPPTGDANIEIGAGATENRNAYIDLVGDTTYSDYGLRIIRADTGADTDSSISHRGTGSLHLLAEDAGSIRFSTNNAARLSIGSGGNVGVGTTNPNQLLHVHQPDAAQFSTLRLSNADGVGLNIAAASTQDVIIFSTETGDNLIFGTEDTERMRITDTGNVIINEDLDVGGAYTGSIASVGASNVIDCSASNYFIETVAGAVTFSFSNVPVTKSYGLTLEIDYQSGSISWPSAVQWPGGAAPTLTAGKTQLIVLVTSDSGTTWRGNALADFDT